MQASSSTLCHFDTNLFSIFNVCEYQLEVVILQKSTKQEKETLHSAMASSFFFYLHPRLTPGTYILSTWDRHVTFICGDALLI